MTTIPRRQGTLLLHYLIELYAYIISIIKLIT
jgi:hypothetical protein